MNEIIFLNGRFISGKKVKAPVFGRGLFETMRSYDNNIVYLKQHLRRLKRSSGVLKLNVPYSSGEIKRFISGAVKRCRAKDIYLRITLWQGHHGSDFMIMAKKYQPYAEAKYKRGFSVSLSALRQVSGSFLAAIKSINRIFYEFAWQSAKNNGFDEALIINDRGFICEASRSNIFFLKGKTLFTPGLKCGCLAGITRQVIMDIAKKHSIAVKQGNFTVRDLKNAQGAFLTNSLIGIMPLTKIENQPINNCRINHLIRFFIRQYRQILRPC